MATQTETRRFTAEDFERLPEGLRIQLIDGELVLHDGTVVTDPAALTMPSPAPVRHHQETSGRLYRLLWRWMETSGDAGHLYYAPIDVYLAEDVAVQPDLVYVSAERRAILGDSIRGAPDWVCEVLSPSTAYYDLTTKKRAYAEAGVEEYWIADPGGQTVEVHTREGDRFALHARAENGRIGSALLKGFEIALADVFAA